MPATAVETRKHNKIPYVKIATLYTEGKTYEAIAKRVNRLNSDAGDPTKSVRAIVSRMVTIGYENENGKIVKLKKRPGSRGMTPKTKVAVKVTPKTKANPKKEAKNVKKTSKSAIAIMVTGDGQHVRLTVPRKENLIPISVFQAMTEKVLEQIAPVEAEPVAQVENLPEVQAVVEATAETVAEPTEEAPNTGAEPEVDLNALAELDTKEQAA